jgi:hypothetical protein
MQKFLIVITAIIFTLPVSAFASGFNIFSSDNEQYGIASSTYQNLATVYGYKAESNYLRHLMYTQMGDTHNAEVSLEAYHYCLAEAARNAELADQYLKKVVFRVPDLDNNSALNQLVPFPSFTQALMK